MCLIPISHLYLSYIKQKLALDLILVSNWYESCKKVPNTNTYHVLGEEKPKKKTHIDGAFTLDVKLVLNENLGGIPCDTQC
jgi:hypothetical protein